MASKKPAAKVVAKAIVKKTPAKIAVAKNAKPPLPVKKVAISAKKETVLAKKPAPVAKSKSVVSKKPVVKAVVNKSAKKIVAIKAASKPIAKAITKIAPKAVAKNTTVKLPVKPAAKNIVAPKTQQKIVAKKIESKKELPAVAAPIKAAAKPVDKNGKVIDHAKNLAKAVSKARADEKLKKAIAKPEIKKPLVLPKFNTKAVRKYEPDFTKSVLDKAPVDRGATIIMYSDGDLMEFKELIQRKLGSAKKELAYLQGLITRKDDTGGDDSDGRYMTMEDGSLSMEREQLSQMASRQISFVDHLEKALIRIENKTYGVCRVTGKLIDKARLRAVPHATLSIEAKMSGGR